MGGEIFLPAFSSAEPAYVSDALRNLRNGSFPMVFIFDRNISLEILRPEFLQDGRYIRYSGAEGLVVGSFSHAIQIFEVAADDAPLQDPQAIDRFEVGTYPMPRIGT